MFARADASAFAGQYRFEWDVCCARTEEEDVQKAHNKHTIPSEMPISASTLLESHLVSPFNRHFFPSFVCVFYVSHLSSIIVQCIT